MMRVVNPRIRIRTTDDPLNRGLFHAYSDEADNDSEMMPIVIPG